MQKWKKKNKFKAVIVPGLELCILWGKSYTKIPSQKKKKILDVFFSSYFFPPVIPDLATPEKCYANILTS